eukprot:Gb_00929 [translate_table: standard]
MPYTALPQSIKDSKCKIVYVARNPKDTFVSLWHFYNNLEGISQGSGSLDNPSKEDIFDAFCSKCTTQGLSILKCFPQLKQIKPPRQITSEIVNREGAWAFFDGAAQGEPQICGAEGILCIKALHTIKFKAGLGKGTNNYAELMALKLRLFLAGEKGVSRLQVFGDSMVVIKWMRKERNCLNYLLQPLLEETQRACKFFNNLSFFHVCREMNSVADALSKAGIQMSKGHWFLQEEREGHVAEYYHPSYHDSL